MLIKSNLFSYMFEAANKFTKTYILAISTPLSPYHQIIIQPPHHLGHFPTNNWRNCDSCSRYDLDQNTFSPPTEDDSFFYIRYPKAESKRLEHEGNNNGPVYRSVRDVLQNHTPPCQEFIPANPCEFISMF